MADDLEKYYVEHDEGPRRLYVYRPVKNWKDIMEWAHDQGIKTTLEEWDFHVTIMYSEGVHYWSHNDADPETLMIRGGERSIELFGDPEKPVLVLEIESPELSERHQELIEQGATPTHSPYRAHITISYKGKGVDVASIKPYTGDIKLAREWWQEAGDNPYGKRSPMTNHIHRPTDDFQSFGKAQVLKVSSSLGLVFGYAIVCKQNGEDYYDHHEDHIPEEAMLKAATDFMKSERVSGDMHGRTDEGGVVADGEVVFAFPLTTDIAKSLDITTEKTGLLVALQPSPEVLEKFKSGEYTGFSIGGKRIRDQEVD